MQNRIELTRKILIQFLKKEKLVGVMYVYGYSKYGSHRNYNIIKINDTINTIGSTFSEKAMKSLLKSIIGTLYPPSHDKLIFPKNGKNFG